MTIKHDLCVAGENIEKLIRSVRKDWKNVRISA